MRTEIIGIIGSGGHAKVVIDVLDSDASSTRVRVFDMSPEKIGKIFCDRIVEDWSGAIELDVPLHLAFGDCHLRAQLGAQLDEANLTLVSVISSRAIISKTAIVANGSFIASGAIIAPEANIGRSTIINHNSVVDHETVVGEFCHIGPGVTIAGGCAVGSKTLIGAGANILPGIRIADGVSVGAGAVVTRDVAEGAIVIGVPAREIGHE